MSPVALRLSVMMFLQFFVWGAWYVTAPLYLGKIGFEPTDFGWLYSVGPIAGIIAPFFVGMVADRFFPTERMLGVLHIAGGGLILAATTLMRQSGTPDMINLVFLAHMLCYFPTLALTNSLAMTNLDDTEKQFPIVRVFGTAGWIVANVVVGQMEWGTTIDQFYLAAGAAVLLGFYSFTLPHTPPPNKGQEVSARELLGVDAFVMFRRPSFAVFMICSFLICIPLAFYYQLAAKAVEQAEIGVATASLMSLGQVSEVLFMVLMPLFFVRLGVKWMLAVGMLAWVVRYGLFAVGAPDDIAWMMIVGIVLHGICYDFFFVTGQIYTDKSAPPAIRSQAQGMLVLFTLGLGMLIGAQVAGRIEAKYTPAETGYLNAEAAAAGEHVKPLKKELEELSEAARTAADPEAVELPEDLATTIDTAVAEDASDLLPRIAAANTAISDAGEGDDVKALTAKRDELLAEKLEIVDQQVTQAIEPAVESSKLEGDAAKALRLKLGIAQIEAYGGRRGLEALNLLDWKSIWLIPCVASAVVLLVFVVVFHDRSADESVSSEDVAEADATTEGGTYDA